MIKITIIDYGAGNIKSLVNAFEFQGINVETTYDRDKIKKATHIVLPGVGAFPNAMSLLEEKKIINDLKEHCFKKKPFLGICLGMQLMFEFSNEIHKTNGLSLLDGYVELLPKSQIKKSNFRIPNIGWLNIKNNNEELEKEYNFDNEKFYFIHSYHCVASEKKQITFHSYFNEYKFCSAIIKENIIGFQFHPEKSRKQGLKLLNKFSKM